MQFVLVDPDPTSAAALRYLLGEAGHDVVLATNVPEACRAAVATPPDAVLVAGATPPIDLGALRDALRSVGYTGPILTIEPGEQQGHRG